ncbi:hypothetical protein [Thalassobacillus sp. C254]|uniref:hypothetical protein n=1 Tax=Thalassobacillus sp. C254 TaxID=1225341 RepID=UPI0012EE44D1|nr:hypothetical protein [Thalassobacillus sp. C254]
MLAEDLLLPYLQQIGADQSNPQFCEEVMKIVGQARSNQTFAYYQLAFLLNGHKEFLFEQHTFTDVDSLVNYLYKKATVLRRSPKV